MEESEEVEEEAVAEAKVTKHDGEDHAKKNPNFAKDIKKAKLIAILWALPGITGAFMIGLVALNYFGPV